MMESEKTAGKQAPPKQENILVSLALNIVLPILVLRRGEEYLGGPEEALVVALLFPVGYFVYDWFARRKRSWIAVLGFINVLLTGVIGLFTLPVFWVAVKEAAVPLLIGLAVLFSISTSKPLVKLLLYNEQFFDVERIAGHLRERGTQAAFDGLLRRCTWVIFASFMLSAVLNFVLARALVTTEPAADISQYNAEVGKMLGWSWAVITIPTMVVFGYAIYLLSRGLKELAGLSLEEAVHSKEGP